MKISKFLESNKGVIVSAFKSLFLGLLKMQAVGGLKGWIIKTIVTEFSEEVFEFIQVNVDYYEIKKKVNSTVDNKDRNEATDNLNNVFDTY